MGFYLLAHKGGAGKYQQKGLNPDSGDTSFLHLKQVYPLHSSVTDYLKKAEDVIIMENNAQGQMANLIQLETGLEIQEKYLKYNGMPFSVEEVEKDSCSSWESKIVARVVMVRLQGEVL
jgi:pyruvate/2-oxoacid:ferredoxin oxidoreductase alpha subunit